MANNALMLGRSYLDNGDLLNAAIQFEQVWDMDDEDREISEERALAGVFLCLTRARARQMTAARSACTAVLQMPDAPQQVKANARTLLDKLN
jgi:hypothetical protein